MSPINDYKRKWQVRNNSNQIVIIGDLDKVPSFNSGASHNLLRYATEEEIKDSEVLALLLANGTLTLAVSNDFTSGVDSL
jgi:hypothetical protein